MPVNTWGCTYVNETERMDFYLLGVWWLYFTGAYKRMTKEKRMLVIFKMDYSSFSPQSQTGQGKAV
jgi:hypothetical protein